MAIILNSKKFIPPVYKALIYPSIFLIAITALLLTSIKMGIAQITREQNELSSLAKNTDILSSKEAVLREVQNSAVSQVDSVVGAVPSKNPLLLVISQIKNLASEKGLILSRLQAGGESKAQTTLSSGDISFDIEGDTSSILNFVKTIAEASPLMTIEKISLTQTANSTLGSIVLKSYWASLPDKIPSTTDSLAGLTPDEQKTLTKIQGLLPAPYSQLVPESPTRRENPFNF